MSSSSTDRPARAAELVRSVRARARFDPRLIAPVTSWTAGAAVVSVLFAIGAWQRRWIADDGLIVLRTIDNLYAGNGPVFNAGERVEANTSTAWTYLLAFWGWVTGAQLEYVALWTALVLSVAALPIAMYGTARLFRNQVTGARISLLLPLGAVIYIALPPARDFATSGLENGLVIFWVAVLWCLLVAWSRRDPDARTGAESARTRGRHTFALLFLTFWAGLAPLIRPEVTILGGLVLVLLFFSRIGWKLRVAMVVVAAAVPVGYQIFRMGYYAVLVPNPAIAKDASGAKWHQGFVYLDNLFTPYHLTIGLVIALACGVVAVAAGWLRRGDRPAAPVAADAASEDLVALSGADADSPAAESPAVESPAGDDGHGDSDTAADRPGIASAETDADSDPADTGRDAEPGAANVVTQILPRVELDLPETEPDAPETGLDVPEAGISVPEAGENAEPGAGRRGGTPPLAGSRRAAARWRRFERGLQRPSAAVAVVLFAGLVLGAYWLRQGGDFMHGRVLLTPLFILLLPVMVIPVVLPDRVRSVRGGFELAGAATMLALWVGAVWWAVAVHGETVTDDPMEIGRAGIVDERRFYSANIGNPNPVTAEDYLDYPRMRAMMEMIEEHREAGGVLLPSGHYDEWYYSEFPDRLPPDKERQLTVYFLNLGMTGMLAPLDVRVVDQMGLAYPIAAHTERLEDGRIGHDKNLPSEWVIAETGANRNMPGFIDGEDVREARWALSCPQTLDRIASYKEPWSFDRAKRNLRQSFGFNSYRTSRIPEYELLRCGIVIPAKSDGDEGP